MKLVKPRGRDSEARYRLLVDRLPDAILIHCGGKCVFANAATARLFGATSSRRILGQDMIDLIHPDFWEFFQHRINLDHGGEHKKFQEIKILRLDGHPVDVEIMALAINYQGLPAFQMVLRNTLSCQLAEEALRKSKEHLHQAAAQHEALANSAQGLAHDLNNLLTAILANIHLAATDPSSAPELPDRLVAAEQGCYQAQTLVRHLQILAKGETPAKKSQDLGKILKEAVRLFVTGSKSRAELSLPEHLYDVEANLGQMQQAFGNLLSNAVLAMPAGGLIRVQAQNLAPKDVSSRSLPPGRYVLVTVSDQGQGISPEHLHKIFDPFFTTKPNGHGLGLATVQAIVNHHQGHIAVESQLGGGTTFQIVLPASDRQIILPPQGEITACWHGQEMSMGW